MDKPVPMETVPSGPVQLRTLDDVARLGETLARSGYFKDTRDAAQAVVKVLYGAEIGVAPVQAMMGVHIIEGKPAPGAGIIAALVKRSGKYTYRAKRHDEKGCVLEFFERLGDRWESVGEASFLEEDARRAGLTNRGPWKAYPKNMYFARALTNGARFYCPDVFGGSVYVPEELGADVDVEGNVKVGIRPPGRLGFPGEELYAGPPEPTPAEAEVVPPEEAVVLDEAEASTAAPEHGQILANIRALVERVTPEHWKAFEAYVEEQTEGWEPHGRDRADVDALVNQARDRVEAVLAERSTSTELGQ